MGSGAATSQLFAPEEGVDRLLPRSKPLPGLWAHPAPVSICRPMAPDRVCYVKRWERRRVAIFQAEKALAEPEASAHTNATLLLSLCPRAWSPVHQDVARHIVNSQPAAGTLCGIVPHTMPSDGEPDRLENTPALACVILHPPIDLSGFGSRTARTPRLGCIH